MAAMLHSGRFCPGLQTRRPQQPPVYRQAAARTRLITRVASNSSSGERGQADAPAASTNGAARVAATTAQPRSSSSSSSGGDAALNGRAAAAAAAAAPLLAPLPVLTPAQQQLVVPDAPPVNKPPPPPQDAAAAAAAAAVAVAAPSGAAAEQQPWVWKGAKLRAAAIAAGLGLAVRYGAPIPEGVDAASWSLLAFFVTTVAGLVLEPLAPGGWALMCAGAALLSGAISFDEAFSATGSPVLWLIVNAFFLAKAIEKTGLGERIAEALVARFGGSTRSLGASLAVGEALLCPGMPSTTARAAGIFVPVIKSVSAAGGSLPNDGAGRLKIGAYLTLSQLQCVAHSSALFATASAQNLLCLQLAEAAGVDLGNGFATWAQGAVVPAALGVLLTPQLVYWLMPPTVQATPEAPRAAAARLEQLGPLAQDEVVTCGAIAVALALWVFGEQYGVPPVVGAMLAVGLLLGAGALDWRRDCLGGCPQAFDTLFWFGALVSMSAALQERGVVGAFTGQASGALAALDLGWPALFAGLHVVFYASHYLFASQTAHVGALYTGFLSLMLAAGVPPKLAAMSLAYNVCLMGGLTHYASSQAAAYAAAGYFRLGELYRVGAACGAAALALWGTVGMGWWKALGWW